MAEQIHERKPSPAKAEVARNKARDPSTGKFLSEEEKNIVLAQRQQAQFEAERAKVSNLLGRSSQPQMQPQMNPLQQMQSPQSNFQAILQSNKPGSDQDMNRWNTLLGRDTTSKGRKKYRW